jgi:hypothetical protein
MRIPVILFYPDVMLLWKTAWFFPCMRRQLGKVSIFSNADTAALTPSAEQRAALGKANAVRSFRSIVIVKTPCTSGNKAAVRFFHSGIVASPVHPPPFRF